MSKTFTYTKITEKVYLENTDEYEEFGEDFEYEVDDRDLEYACAELLYDDYFKKSEMNDYACYWSAVRNALIKFIRDFDLLDILFEAYEDDLKEYFKEEAMGYLD